MYGGDNQPGMQCVEWEALLAEALDGTLHGSTLAGFEGHQLSCPSCQATYADAAAGMHWLKELEEAEPPKHLVHNILAQTIGSLPEVSRPVTPARDNWVSRIKGRLVPSFAPVVSPRFAMSFGMAFFSITMLLSIAGFHMSDLRHLDMSRKSLVKTYYSTEARVVRYYENMRLVYEIESRVRDLRRAATPEAQPKQEEPATPKNPNKSQSQPQKNDKWQNNSRENNDPVYAGSPAVSDVATKQARLNRRTA